MNTIKTLTSIFNKIAPNENRLTVFSDFIKLGAIAHQNQSCFSQELEDSYLAVVARYPRADIDKMCSLLGELTIALYKSPQDYLGQMYMELEISNKRLGQTFTPHHLQVLLSKLVDPDVKTPIEQKGFVTVSEPCCGSGGTIIQFAQEVIQQGYRPNKHLFALASDIDINSVYMTYLQLAILNIPAQVIHSNTLTMEVWSTYSTPALFTDLWANRLLQKENKQYSGQLLEAV